MSSDKTGRVSANVGRIVAAQAVRFAGMDHAKLVEGAVVVALAIEDAVAVALRPSGPTSTEKKCKHGKGTICCDFDCPRHGHG